MHYNQNQVDEFMIGALIGFTNALYHPPILEIVTKEEIRDALSRGQIESKKWLLKNLFAILNSQPQRPVNFAVAGGWVGLLALALNLAHENFKADSIDINPNYQFITRYVLDLQKGQSLLADMHTFDFSNYHCIINTSSEHILNLEGWVSRLPKDALIVLQSNNDKKIKDHINCVDSKEELAQKSGLKNILYSGQIEFPFYTRYMVIGKR